MTKILVVEDDPNLRAGVVQILELEGYEVFAAENGKIGLELAQKQLPDLILCDVMMPELDGYGLLQALRKDPATEAIPFIFITAKAAKEDLRQGMNLGADDYLTKPFETEELLEAISSRLERQFQVTKEVTKLRQNISMALPHELRTPLTAILGMAELLQVTGNSLNPEEVIDLGKNIYKSGLRLKRVIENYVLYAELITVDATQMKPELETPLTHPNELVASASTSKAEEKNRPHDLVLKLGEEHPLWFSDEHLYKILTELVDNGLKFSQPGQPVTVSTRVEHAQWVLQVSDLGLGMTPEQIHDIGAYMQFDRDKHEQQGCGLGLAIVKHLAKLYDGDFEVESIPNNGTTVTVRLPIETTL